MPAEVLQDLLAGLVSLSATERLLCFDLEANEDLQLAVKVIVETYRRMGCEIVSYGIRHLFGQLDQQLSRDAALTNRLQGDLLTAWRELQTMFR